MDGGAPTVEQETLCLSNGGGVLRLNMMTMNARRMKEQIDDPYDDPKCKKENIGHILLSSFGKMSALQRLCRSKKC